MNITGQTDDKKLQFGKTGEIILTPAAFAQALKTMQDVDSELKKRVEEANKAKKKLLKVIKINKSVYRYSKS